MDEVHMLPPTASIYQTQTISPVIHFTTGPLKSQLTYLVCNLGQACPTSRQIICLH